MSKPKRIAPPPGSSRPALEADPDPRHGAAQPLEQGEKLPFTLEHWNTLFESGHYSVTQLEARIQDLPVTSRSMARLLLEMFSDELEPG